MGELNPVKPRLGTDLDAVLAPPAEPRRCLFLVPCAFWNDRPKPRRMRFPRNDRAAVVSCFVRHPCGPGDRLNARCVIGDTPHRHHPRQRKRPFPKERPSQGRECRPAEAGRRRKPIRRDPAPEGRGHSETTVPPPDDGRARCLGKDGPDADRGSRRRRPNAQASR